MGYRAQNLTLPIISAQLNRNMIFFFHSSLSKPLFCAGEAYESSKLWLIAREPRIHFLDFPFPTLPVTVLPIYSSLECDATSRQLLQFSGFKICHFGSSFNTHSPKCCSERPDLAFAWGYSSGQTGFAARKLCPFS